MRRTKADKKLRSILFLVLGSEGKRVFTQKNPRVKILAITFSEFWTLPDAAFNKPPNTTFERYKLLNRKQKDRESYEQFWGALTDLASTCNIKESDETEWISNIFICNMKNTDTQRKLLSATISPSEALNQALIDEKGYFNQQKLTNMSRSSTNGTTWNEYGQSDDDDFSVLSVRTIYDKNGLETKKLLNLGIGWDMIVNMNIPVDSASPVNFFKTECTTRS